MKIGYFVETPVEHNLTGGSRSFLNLVENLKDQGIEPFVVVSEEWALTEELKRIGIPYITSKMYRPFVGTTNKTRFYHLKYYTKLVFNTRARDKAVNWFRKNSVQLVHINSQFAGIVGSQVAQKLKIPYIYHIREFLDSDFGVTFYSPKLVDRYIKPANKIIAISKSIKNFYENKFGRELSLVYNGIPIKENSYLEQRERFSGEQIHLAIVGRVCEAKGQQEAVEAIKILVKEYGVNNICLHVVGFMGTDAYELKLREYINNNNLQDNIVLHKFTNNPFELIKDCDIGLMCSVTEAFGRVTVEYMFASLCVIGANTGGTIEIIEDGKSGLIYKQGNTEDLAAKIKYLIDNNAEANRMMNNGRERALKYFTIESTADSIKKLYDELI